MQLTSYTCVLGALLGTAHPNVLEHQLAIKKLVVNQALLKQFANAEFGSKLGAAKIVYYFQLRHQHWFGEQWRLTTKTTFPPPKLAAGFNTFVTSYTINWLPNTNHVNILQHLKNTPVAVASGTDNTGRPTSDGEKDDNSSSQTNGESNSKRKGISNHNHDPRVMGKTPLAKQIRQHPISDALAKAGTPPATTRGKACWLSWHLKEKCYNDCVQKADHIILPIEHADTLVEWCTQAYH